MRGWIGALGVSLLMTCSACVGLIPGPEQPAPAATSNAEAYAQPYVDGCKGYEAELRPKLDALLPELAGEDGKQSGSELFEELQKLEVELDLGKPEASSSRQRELDALRAKAEATGAWWPEVEMVYLSFGGVSNETLSPQQRGERQVAASELIGPLSGQLMKLYIETLQAEAYAFHCGAYPLAGAMLIVNGRANGNLEAASDLEDVPAVRKIGNAARRVEAQYAVLLSLYSAYQGVALGELKPSVIDDLISSGRETLSSEPVMTQGEVESILRLARKQLAEERVRENERLRQLAQQQATTAPAAGQSGDSDAASAVGLLTSLLSGNVAGVVQHAIALLPEDSTLGQAVKGTSAAVRGDHRGALRAMSKLAPKDSPLARTANDVAETAQSTRQLSGSD